MGNILHYLKWRGDLTFEERPFNEADNHEIVRSGRKKQRLLLNEEESILSELRDEWLQEQEKRLEERKYDPYISG